MIGQGMLLDDYIAKLQFLRERWGNVQCWAGGGDYPEGATGPVIVMKEGAYVPAGVVNLQ